MKQNNRIKTMKASDLKLDYTINDRFHGSLEVLPGVKVDTYAINLLLDQVVEAGQINEALYVDGKDNTVLRGMRRATVAKLIADNDAYPAELRKAMNSVPVIVYDDLTPNERLMLIHDKGDRKGLGRAELLAAIWRMYEQNFTEAEISVHQVYNVAKYTGNEKKLNTLPSDPTARNKQIQKWLHGTVGNFMLAGYDCGPRVRKAMLLTELAADGLLPKDKDGKEVVKPEWTVKRAHITDLVSARTEDSKADEWDGTNFSGPRFNAKLSEILSGVKPATPIDGEEDEKAGSAKTLAELKAFDGKAKSLIAKATLRIAANEKVFEFPELDAAAARWEQVGNLLAKYVSEFSNPLVTELVSAIVGMDNLANLDFLLQSYCEKPGTEPEVLDEMVVVN